MLTPLTELSEVDINRIESLKQEFKRIAQSDLNYVIFAPGRVNLIGDHIDYHDYSVLPMAIQKSILVGVRIDFDGKPGDKSRLTIINKNQDKHPQFSTEHTFGLGAKLDTSNHWYNYILCGYHGILTSRYIKVMPENVVENAKLLASKPNLLRDADLKLSTLPNLTLFVDSNLPEASGLSSSSALVCAAAIATECMLHEHKNFVSGNSSNYPYDKDTLASLCSYSEWLIGTRGGGMDHVVILVGREGRAPYITFDRHLDPSFDFNSMKLPDACWIVSHCGSSYQKAASQNFNMRVIETKLAAAIISKREKLDIPIDSSITLRKVEQKLFFDHDEMLAFIEKFFTIQKEFTFKQVASILGFSTEQLVDCFKINKSINTSSDIKLKLYKRTLHVVSEAHRVDSFTIFIRKPDKLGDIMLESHASLNENYEVSTKKLDQVVNLAMSLGALGSRLTGAGFGGCVITLCYPEMRDKVMSGLKRSFGQTFEVVPSEGCRIAKLKDCY